MNVAVSFVPSEIPQARRWFEWCEELGNGGNHDLFVSPFKGMPFDLGTIKGWKSVTHIPDWIGATSDWSGGNEQRDARGPNESWRGCARWFADNHGGPWLWCEPDCIPTTRDWLDRIEAEYRRGGKPFMGALVSIEGIPDHMTGNAVYPQEAGHTCLKLMLPRHAMIGGRPLEIAFDVAGADDTLPSAHLTNLVIHRFRQPPICSREEFERLVPVGGALYHSDKTGAVIPFLRERLGLSPVGQGVACKQQPALGILDAHESPTGGTAAAKPKVHTYFSAAPVTDLVTEQKRLLELWQQQWEKAGFEVVILTEYDARKHPRFEQWSKALLAKPTVNPAWYERACWTRWIAMADIGGLLVDYDVLPSGFKAIEPPSNGTNLPTMLCDRVPCAVVGSKQHYEAALAAFEQAQPTTEKGQPHLSDMHACAQAALPHLDVVREYGVLGWQNAKLIHFSNATRHGRKRSEIIEDWLSGMLKVNETPIKAADKLGETKLESSGEFQVIPNGMEIQQLHVPPTFTGQIRNLADQINRAISNSHSRKQTAVNILRKAGLIPAPKKRKRKKWMV